MSVCSKLKKSLWDLDPDPIFQDRIRGSEPDENGPGSATLFSNKISKKSKRNGGLFLCCEAGDVILAILVSSSIISSICRLIST